MRYAECPNCEGMVNISGSPKVGQEVTCKFCDTKLAIVWLDPLELDWQFDESIDEDYGYEDEEEYDYEDY